MKRLWVGGALAVALSIASCGPASGATQPTPKDSNLLSGTATGTWQTNGTVYSMVYAANPANPGHGKIYIAGNFTGVRPPHAPAGTGEVSRTNIAAFDATTGALDTSFAPVFDSMPRALAVSPSGDRLYVGGNFQKLNGNPSTRLVAFNVADDSLSSWTVKPDYLVTSLATYGDTVYIGGGFGHIVGSDKQYLTRVGLAAASASSAAILPWNPQADNVPYALAVSSDGGTVFAAGAFSKISGAAKTWSAAAISASSGQPRTDFANGAHSVIPATTSSCTSASRDVVVSGDDAFFGNEGTGGGCFDGTFAATVSNGGLKWVNRCLGATQAVEVVQGWLYKGSHAHDCQSTNPNGDPDNFPQSATANGGARHLLSESLSNGWLGPWYPNTNAGTVSAGSQTLGPHAMATDGVHLWVGGDFTAVNGQPQQGLVEFSPGDSAPNAPGQPTASVSGRTVNVSIQSPTDLDDTDLSLQLLRDNVAVGTPVKVHSLFWNRPTVTLTDSNVPPGSHVYTVVAKDGQGMTSKQSPPVTVQVS